MGLFLLSVSPTLDILNVSEKKDKKSYILRHAHISGVRIYVYRLVRFEIPETTYRLDFCFYSCAQYSVDFLLNG